MRRAITIGVAVSLIFGQSAPALAYLKFGVPIRGQQVTVKGRADGVDHLPARGCDFRPTGE